MSINQNNSVLIKSVQHTNRFLNANINNNSNNNMFNLQNSNNARKFSKSVSISNTLNSTNLSSNASLNQYQYHYSNTTNTNNNNTNSSANFTTTNQSSNFPSTIKNNMTPSFASTRKFATDYQQAVRFDYSDAFVNNHNIDFLTRVSQMQRLQMETVDWERKKKLSKKKLPTAENNKKD